MQYTTLESIPVSYCGDILSININFEDRPERKTRSDEGRKRSLRTEKQFIG